MLADKEKDREHEIRKLELQIDLEKLKSKN